MSKSFLLALFSLVYFTCSALAVTSDNAQPVLLYADPLPTTQKRRETLDRIAALRQSRDLEGLSKLCEVSLESLKRTHAPADIEAIDLATGALFSTDFGIANVSRQAELSNKYSSEALREVPAMPVDVVVNLLPRITFLDDLQKANGKLEGEEWAKLRRQRAVSYLQAWRRINDSIVPENNTHKVLILNPPLSLEDLTPEGAQRRAKELAVIHRKLLELNTQVSLRQTQSDFAPVLESYIEGAYAKPPVGLPELSSLLDTYKVDGVLKNKILSNVSKRLADLQNTPSEKAKEK